MNKNINWFSISIGSIFLASLMINDAYAYIDAGTGSMIFQMLIGALVGVGIAVKVFWEKIKFSVSSRFARNESK